MLDDLEQFLLSKQFPESDSDIEGSSEVEPAHVSRPLLRSRPAIDFPSSGLGMDLDRPQTKSTIPHMMSGSTLCSRSDSHLHKQKISPEDIASLSIAELYHNPHHQELRQDYDHLVRTMTTVLGRDLMDSWVTVRSSLTSDIVMNTGL